MLNPQAPIDFGRWLRPARSGVVLAFLLSCGLANADVIYRETFGRTNGATGNLNPSLFGWQHFLSTGNAETGNNGVSADGTGKPTDLANVNAGPNLDGTFDAEPEGWHYLDSSRRLTFTPEFSFALSDYVPGSIVFSWYQGNAYITEGMHLIVRIAGVWYVSVAGITNVTAVTSGANFGNEADGAVPVSMIFDPAAANWNLLNFNGDFDHLTTNRVNSTMGAPTAGSPASSDLAGTITAFGLWRGHDNTGFGNTRFDTFAIEATPNTGSPPKQVRWGGGASADWDTVTENWVTNGLPATTYRNGDFVRLDDSATGPTTINMVAVFQPGSMTISNQTLTYELGGSGGLGGNTGLKKQGTGSLTLANVAANTYSGPTLIEQGTLNVGNGDVGGSLGLGTITNQGALVFNRSSGLTLDNGIHGSGSLTQNGTGDLVLGGNSSYTGNTIVNAGSLVVNGNLSGGGQLTVASGARLSGVGTHSGPVISSGNVSPGTSPGTLTLGALTLQTGATLTYDAAANNTVGGGVNDLLQVNGNLTLNNNAIAIGLPDVPQTGVPYRVINFTGARSGSFGPATVSGGSRFSPAVSYNDGSGQVNVTFTGTSAALRWASMGDPNWDVGVSSNWVNQAGGQPEGFYTGDSVLFDDSPGVVINVDIPPGLVLKPALVTVDSTNNWFWIDSAGGGGHISGAASIVKNGDSTFTLSTANDFTGNVSVNKGTLIVGNNAALGTTNGVTIVANGATLDLGNPTAAENAVNLGTEQIIVSGSGVFGGGAIVNNSSASQQNALQRVTLTGDTVWGGNARWDIRASASQLSTGGNAYKLTKIGGNQINIVNCQVDPALGDIEIQSGQFGIQGPNASPISVGDPTKTMTVFGGATVRFTTWTNVLRKVLVMQDSAIINNTSGSNIFGGPVTLEGNVTFNIGGTALTMTNTISGAGMITKITGASPLYLAGSNTYSGQTLILNGILALTGSGSIEHSALITILTTLSAAGRTDGTFSLAAGQKLEGIGNITGSLLTRPGSTLSPGVDSIGTLTVANIVTLQGTNYMEVDKNGGSYDQLVGGPIMNLGGVLVVTNLSQDFAPLEAGDSFPLFSAVSYSGGFASIVPATPGNGLAWDTSTLLSDGTLRVKVAGASQPQIGNTLAIGGQFILAGSNGPAGGTYHVLTHTNVGAALNTWTLMGPFNFDSNGNFSFTNGAPSESRRFYLLQVP